MRFFVIVGCVCLAVAEDATDSPARDGPVRMCGSHLADTLSVVCNGYYNELFISRNGPYSALVTGDGSQGINIANWPQLASEKLPVLPGGVQGRHRRRRSGIINECCFRGCTRRELSFYCGL